MTALSVAYDQWIAARKEAERAAAEVVASGQTPDSPEYLRAQHMLLEASRLRDDWFDQMAECRVAP